MSEEKQEKKINEIEIDNLIKIIYKKIADWHNDDTTQMGLKYMVFDIIQDCTNNTLEQLGLEKVTTDVKIDKGEEKTKFPTGI